MATCRGYPTPPEDRNVIDSDATLGQQFFHVSLGEPVAQVPANCERDHIRREPKAREAGPHYWYSRRATTHRPSLPDLVLHRRNPIGSVPRTPPGRLRTVAVC
jgi:hypothetical protein